MRKNLNESNEELNYIIFNNRSRKLVDNFLPKIDNISNLIELEKRFSFINSLYKLEYEVGIDENDIIFDYDDIIFTKEDLENLILDYPLLDEHREWLNNRGIDDSIIEEYNIQSFTDDMDKSLLDIIGVNLHNSLSNIIGNQTNGIFIPYYVDGKLVNVISRRLIIGPLKYTLAIPDVTIFGDIADEVWIVEGFFDYIALSKHKDNVLTVSSASWSTLQLYKLISNNVSKINYVADYDYTGLRTAQLLKRFFGLYNIEFRCYISNSCKDMSEHFHEHSLTVDDIEETIPTNELLDELKEDSDIKYSNFIEYLKHRKI